MCRTLQLDGDNANVRVLGTRCHPLLIAAQSSSHHDRVKLNLLSPMRWQDTY